MVGVKFEERLQELCDCDSHYGRVKGLLEGLPEDKRGEVVK